MQTVPFILHVVSGDENAPCLSDTTSDDPISFVIIVIICFTGIWNTCHTFLSLGKGDLENHVLLLCSLLLGFGLDAYVCVGTVCSGGGGGVEWGG